jgi:hypothetical protein
LPEREQGNQFEIRNRQKYGVKPLHEVNAPEELTADEVVRYWKESKGSAASWFYFPKVLTPVWIDDAYFFEANNTYVALLPLSKDHFVVNPDEAELGKIEDRSCSRFFQKYALISFPGQYSGFVVEAAEKQDFGSLHDFAASVREKTKLRNSLQRKNSVNYTSLNGDTMELHYQPTGLRCRGLINGEEQDWDNYTNGAVYESPFLKIKNGLMKISDGSKGYEVDFTGSKPVWLQ